MQQPESRQTTQDVGLMRGIRVREFHEGLIFDATETMYPSRMIGFAGGALDLNRTTSTYFGMCVQGEVVLNRMGLPSIGIASGMFFSGPGSVVLTGSSEAKFVIIEREGYRGLFSVGGPVEREGRLSYIDNCSTSQLVPPARLGDPTLQFLAFPPRTVQTLHVHPTIRLGAVLWGTGECRMSDGTRLSIKPGDVFLINERFAHAFQTGDSDMAVVAYHPDTDTGPTDEDHPMRNRTYLRT